VGYIYSHLQEAAQSFQNLKNRFTQMQADEAKRRQELADLANQLQQFKVGSPQWFLFATALTTRNWLSSLGQKMQIDSTAKEKGPD